METNNSEVTWSEVYSDFFLSEEVLSACSPVWHQPTDVLLGVTCVDVNVTYFMSLTDGEQVMLMSLYFCIMHTMSLGGIRATKLFIS